MRKIIAVLVAAFTLAIVSPAEAYRYDYSIAQAQNSIHGAFPGWDTESDHNFAWNKLGAVQSSWSTHYNLSYWQWVFNPQKWCLGVWFRAINQTTGQWEWNHEWFRAERNLDTGKVYDTWELFGGACRNQFGDVPSQPVT